MKKNLLYILLLVLCPLFLFAQAPDTLWTKVWGNYASDQGYDVQQTSDGGYIVLATTSSYGAGNSDMWLLKTDENGDTIWNKLYGGTGYDRGRAVIQTSDNGFLLAGCKRAADHSRTDLWVIKTNSDGDSLWTFEYGWDSVHYRAMSICETNIGDYILLGEINYEFGILIKIDNVGNILWNRYLSFIGYDVQQTTNNGYIIVGSYRDGLLYHFAYEKTDSLGNQIWYKNYWIGGILFEVQQLTDSGYIMTGRISDRVGLLRTDMDGDSVWIRRYGDYHTDYGKALALTHDGGFVIAGEKYLGSSQQHDVWILRTDSLGDTTGTKIYGWEGDEFINSINRTDDYGYIAVGGTPHFNGAGDVWLLKFEPDTLGINENKDIIYSPNNDIFTTIISGPLLLPEGNIYKVFDITGRTVIPGKIKPGIYFIEIEGEIRQKVVKIR